MTRKSTTLTRQQTPTTSPFSSGILQRKCACGQRTIAGGECEECQKKRSSLQRRSSNQAEPSEVPPIVHEILRSQGQLLETDTRTFMESRFGHDFSQVRVHRDEKAAKSAQAVNALAYTVGQDVVFGNGQYLPSTTQGKILLAHELTHSIQQTLNLDMPAVQKQLDISHPDHATEQEAEAVSRAIVQGQPFHVAISGEAFQVARRNGISSPAPSSTSSCVSGPGLQSPDQATLQRRLVTYGVLQPSGSSTEFTNILYRHVTAGNSVGDDYLQFLQDWAYPMEDFCIVYGGRGWNATFRDVLSFYHMETPRHRAMRMVRRAVEDYARNNLFIYDEAALNPGGSRDPFASPILLRLTPDTLRRKPRDTVLAGYAPEAVLLLLATDDYLTNLTLTAEMVSSSTPGTVSSGGTTTEDVFAWGTATEEDTRDDPNRFDALIVHWVNYYNDLFAPLDRDGNPNPLDPDLVKAMIFVESRFAETAASSRSSARGLTQVLSRERRLVGEWTAGISGVTDTNFSDPGLQIATGILILFEKYRRPRNWRTAIRDYNGSPRREAYANEVMRVYESHRRR